MPGFGWRRYVRRDQRWRLRCYGRRPVRFEETPCTARDDDERGDPGGEPSQRGAPFWRDGSCWRSGLRHGGDANLQRIDPDRIGDVLELGLAKIGDREIEPAL